MSYSRALKYIFRLRPDPIYSSSSSAYSLYITGSRCTGGSSIPSQHRSITSTPTLHGWMDTIKGVFTGNKDTPLEESNLPVEDFTLLRFADELKNAKRLGKFKQYIVGRSSEATFADAFEKQEAIIRYLGARDATGENLQASQKQDAAKHCKCTITEVENTLAKFTWARQAHKKMAELKDGGKPLPKNMGELQKMMGTTPMDLARSNLAKSGQISRNAPCPCGSKKRYKRLTTLKGDVAERIEEAEVSRVDRSFFFDLNKFQITMEPGSSPPPGTPGQNPPPSRTGEPEQWDKGFRSMAIDVGLRERFMSQVRESALGLLEFSSQWKVYVEEMRLKEESVENQALELRKKEERLRMVEERDRKIELLEDSIKERLGVLEEKENEANVRRLEFEELVTQLKAQEELLKDSMLKKHEELVGELEVRKQELKARENKLRMLNETIKEKSVELEKKEEEFQLKQKAEAGKIEVNRKLLKLKEKVIEEREKVLERKQKELEEQPETSKRSRHESEAKSRDVDSQMHTAKKHKPVREHKRDDGEKETRIDPEPDSCPDPDFNEFNKNLSSFAVDQVWALYDPLDQMPRFYAQIRRILKPQLSVEVTWLESLKNTGYEKPIPVACGVFRYGDSEIQSHLTLSHEMRYIKSGKNVTFVNPRKGETWALFRDWNKTWIKDRKQHKPPYRYEFVEVLSELDSDEGIRVAYLKRVEGFTSVYKVKEQHNGLIKSMVSSDQMLRFSHRVPSFKLTGAEKEGVPPGSFELDPAAIPRANLMATKVKEEKIIP
ncbi:unnamed protein product [Thlaspi arvense]|uniref:DUF3444 domain-containing protein n=1 Tax=Thlaspi arvense TaxID=13288 RepID=A0AAU9S146_THLAR|nr:unnamed protein product [Thlaspi arvense]